VPKGYIVITQTQSDEAVFRLTVFDSKEQLLIRENKFLRLINTNLMQENLKLTQVDSVMKQHTTQSKQVITGLLTDVRREKRKSILWVSIGGLVGYLLKTATSK
jgi:hypothetical protein